MTIYDPMTSYPPHLLVLLDPMEGNPARSVETQGLSHVAIEQVRPSTRNYFRRVANAMSPSGALGWQTLYARKRSRDFILAAMLDGMTADYVLQRLPDWENDCLTVIDLNLLPSERIGR